MDRRVQQRAQVAGRFLALSAVALAALGCGVGFKAPYSAAQLASSQHPHKALVRYLAQRSPDAEVCSLNRADGPSVAWADERVVRSLQHAFDEGVVQPQVYADCAVRLWATAPAVRPVLAAGLVDQLARVVSAKAPDAAIDARLDVLQVVPIRSRAGRPGRGAHRRRAPVRWRTSPRAGSVS